MMEILPEQNCERVCYICARLLTCCCRRWRWCKALTINLGLASEVKVCENKSHKCFKLWTYNGWMHAVWFKYITNKRIDEKGLLKHTIEEWKNGRKWAPSATGWMKDGLKKKQDGETESTAKQATKETSRYNKTKEKQQQHRGRAFRYVLHIYRVFYQTKHESV